MPCFSCPVICLSHRRFSEILTIEFHPQFFAAAQFLATLFLLLAGAGVKYSYTFYFPYDD